MQPSSKAGTIPEHQLTSHLTQGMGKCEQGQMCGTDGKCETKHHTLHPLDINFKYTFHPFICCRARHHSTITVARRLLQFVHFWSWHRHHHRCHAGPCGMHAAARSHFPLHWQQHDLWWWKSRWVSRPMCWCTPPLWFRRTHHKSRAETDTARQFKLCWP